MDIDVSNEEENEAPQNAALSQLSQEEGHQEAPIDTEMAEKKELNE